MATKYWDFRTILNFQPITKPYPCFPYGSVSCPIMGYSDDRAQRRVSYLLDLMDDTEDIEVCQEYFSALALSMEMEWGHAHNCIRRDVNAFLRNCNLLVSNHLKDLAASKTETKAQRTLDDDAQKMTNILSTPLQNLDPIVTIKFSSSCSENEPISQTEKPSRDSESTWIWSQEELQRRQEANLKSILQFQSQPCSTIKKPTTGCQSPQEIPPSSPQALSIEPQNLNPEKPANLDMPPLLESVEWSALIYRDYGECDSDSDTSSISISRSSSASGFHSEFGMNLPSAGSYSMDDLKRYIVRLGTGSRVEGDTKLNLISENAKNKASSSKESLSGEDHHDNAYCTMITKHEVDHFSRAEDEAIPDLEFDFADEETSSVTTTTSELEEENLVASEENTIIALSLDSVSGQSSSVEGDHHHGFNTTSPKCNNGHFSRQADELIPLLELDFSDEETASITTTGSGVEEQTAVVSTKATNILALSLWEKEDHPLITSPCESYGHVLIDATERRYANRFLADKDGLPPTITLTGEAEGYGISFGDHGDVNMGLLSLNSTFESEIHQIETEARKSTHEIPTGKKGVKSSVWKHVHHGYEKVVRLRPSRSFVKLLN